MKRFKARVESRSLSINLRYPAAQIADLSNKPGIVVEDPRNRVRTLAPWGVEFGGLDEMGFEIDGAAHNQRYIKSAPELIALSGAD
ncbi:MAG: hypothetical protein AB2387_13735 [Stutzerimonas stutzeri]